jgi:hypothetical protein
VKSAVSERVLKAVAMVVDSGDSIGDCDSKTARKNAHFLCPVLDVVCISCSELAVVAVAGGCEMMLLGVG